jgi:hypothetical protein
MAESSSTSENLSTSTSSSEDLTSSSSSEELSSSTSSEDISSSSTSDDISTSSSIGEETSTSTSEDLATSTSSDPDIHIEMPESGFETTGTDTSKNLKDTNAGPDYNYDETDPSKLKNYNGYGYIIDIRAIPGERTITATHFADGSDHFLYSSMSVQFEIKVTIRNLTTGQDVTGTKTYSATVSAKLDPKTGLLTGKCEIPGATGGGESLLNINHPFSGGNGQQLFLKGHVQARSGGKDKEALAPEASCYIEVQNQSGTYPVKYTGGLPSGSIKPTFRVVKGAVAP